MSLLYEEYPLIFHGKGGEVGAMSLASKLSSSSSVEDPDVRIFKYSSESIKSFLESLHYPPLFGKYKIDIFLPGEALDIHWNAMLKGLEEKRSYCVVILVVDSLDLIPGSVISRCQVEFFSDLHHEDPIVVKEFMEKVCSGDYKEIYSLFDKINEMSLVEIDNIYEELLRLISLKNINQSEIFSFLDLASRVHMNKYLVLQYMVLNIYINK